MLRCTLLSKCRRVPQAVFTLLQLDEGLIKRAVGSWLLALIKHEARFLSTGEAAKQIREAEAIVLRRYALNLSATSDCVAVILRSFLLLFHADSGQFLAISLMECDIPVDLI